MPFAYNFNNIMFKHQCECAQDITINSSPFQRVYWLKCKGLHSSSCYCCHYLLVIQVYENASFGLVLDAYYDGILERPFI